MSVTLGELMGNTDFTITTRRPPKILNNLGQEVNTGHSGPSFGKLQKKDYAAEKGTLYGAESQNVHAEQPGEGVPYNLPGTLIDPSALQSRPGELFGDANEALLYNPNQAHSRFIDDRMSYSAMGPYNSNRVIPSYNYIVGSSPSQMALDQMQNSQNVMTDLNGNRFVAGPGGELMMLPRTTSFASNVNAQQRGIMQYGEFTHSPKWAGGKPLLENGNVSDQSVAMGEPLNQRFDESWNNNKEEDFEPRHLRRRPDCASAMNHVMTCPICSKYFQNDNKMYIAMIIMLVVVFSVLLYMAMKK
jgi:hypothetical protein